MTDGASRARREADEVLDRVLGRNQPLSPSEAPLRKPGTPKRPRSVPTETRNGGHRPAVHLPSGAVIADYRAGRRISELARDYGLHQNTVRNLLKWYGVWIPAGTSGPRRITECKRGHDLAVHGKPASKGGRYCTVCKRESERKRGK